MTRIYTTLFIPAPVETVFAYVSTPGNWPKWHPSSVSVSGAIDHSLMVGEQCVESFLVAGRQGKATWTVVERIPAKRWVITGIIAGSTNGGTVSYTVFPEGDGTRFEREFVYPTRSLMFSVLDLLFIRRRVQTESRLALQQLRAIFLQQAVTP